MTAPGTPEKLYAAIVGVHLVVAAVRNGQALAALFSALERPLSGRYTPDVRWIEGYNAWCGRWAAAQSRPGPPIE